MAANRVCFPGWGGKKLKFNWKPPSIIVSDFSALRIDDDEPNRTCKHMYGQLLACMHETAYSHFQPCGSVILHLRTMPTGELSASTMRPSRVHICRLYELRRTEHGTHDFMCNTLGAKLTPACARLKGFMRAKAIRSTSGTTRCGIKFCMWYPELLLLFAVKQFNKKKTHKKRIATF